MHNKLSSRLLFTILDARCWNQGDLAKRSGIIRSTVSDHLSGQRPIRDEHLIAYLAALDSHERPMLLGAWLRDTLGAEVIRDVLKLPENRIAEPVAEWSPALDDQQRKMLSWWAAELARDPELAEIFRRITLKAGYPARGAA